MEAVQEKMKLKTLLLLLILLTILLTIFLIKVETTENVAEVHACLELSPLEYCDCDCYNKSSVQACICDCDYEICVCLVDGSCTCNLKENGK